jgi:type II secretory pathway pseudopilin PulG
MSRPPDRREAGFSLVGAVAGITIMLTLMAMAMPAWRYVMQDSREEELIFRGTQIVEAIERYQKEKGSLPVSFDLLVKGKYLRKAYADPMSQEGKWRIIHPGEGMAPGRPGGGVRPLSGGLADGTGPRMGQGGFGSGGEMTGPFIGVASRSKENSLRLFNGRSRYDEWIFAMGMPRIIGKPPVLMPGGEGSPSPRPPGSGPGSPRPR